jgi:hypothetical protein
MSGHRRAGAGRRDGANRMLPISLPVGRSHRRTSQSRGGGSPGQYLAFRSGRDPLRLDTQGFAEPLAKRRCDPLADAAVANGE